jgi:hypothetical protein
VYSIYFIARPDQTYLDGEQVDHYVHAADAIRVIREHGRAPVGSRYEVRNTHTGQLWRTWTAEQLRPRA